MSTDQTDLRPVETDPSSTPDPELDRRGWWSRFWNTPGVSNVTSIIVVGSLWEFVVRTFMADSLFIVPISEIAVELYRWFSEGTIWPHIWVSAQEFLAGFALAIAVGIAIGVVMGFSKSVYSLLNPWVALLYATPLIVMTPFFILVFGVGINSKIALAFTVGVFPMIVNTAAGLRASEEKFIELARSFGASSRQMVLKILFPSAVPYILSGLRLSSGRALMGVVVGEFFISRAGVGFLIAQAAQTFRIARLFAGVALFAFAGMAMFALFEWLERRLTPWRHEVEEG
jgi:ABC-type nitrate/sulfonate/bicarbonate transport system permease component